MKNAIIYTRVSTDEQAEKGFSLLDQKTRLEKYCQDHGILVAAHYQEDHSAKNFDDRPAFQKLLKFAKQRKKDIDLLLFINWSRFSRNVADSYVMLSVLKKLGIEPQAIDQPLDLSVPESLIMLSVYLSTPEVENTRRSMNTISGMRRAKKEGRFLGNAPRGYSNSRDVGNKPVIVPNEDATIITSIFEQVAQGQESREEIRRWARRQGFDISKSQYYAMLQNPVYVGKIFLGSYKDEPEMLVDGIHKPLVDQETFLKVQSIIQGKALKTKLPKSYSHREELPLRGFLICPKCGKKLTGSGSKGNGGRYFYYHCDTKCRYRTKAKVMNQSYVGLLQTLRVRPSVSGLYLKVLGDMMKDDRRIQKQKRSQVDQQLEKVEARIAKLQDLLVDGDLTPEDYNRAKARYEAERMSLLSKKEAESMLPEDILDQLETSFSLLEHLPEVYLDANVDQKRRIIGSITGENLVIENLQTRTNELNPFIKCICLETKGLEKEKAGNFSFESEKSGVVAGTGLEPATFGL